MFKTPSALEVLTQRKPFVNRRIGAAYGRLVLARRMRDHPFFVIPGLRQEAHLGMTKPWIASEKIEKYKLKTWAEKNRVARWDREAIGLKLDR